MSSFSTTKQLQHKQEEGRRKEQGDQTLGQTSYPSPNHEAFSFWHLSTFLSQKEAAGFDGRLPDRNRSLQKKTHAYTHTHRKENISVNKLAGATTASLHRRSLSTAATIARLLRRPWRQLDHHRPSRTCNLTIRRWIHDVRGWWWMKHCGGKMDQFALKVSEIPHI